MKNKLLFAGILALALVLGLVFTGCADYSASADVYTIVFDTADSWTGTEPNSISHGNSTLNAYLLKNGSEVVSLLDPKVTDVYGSLSNTTATTGLTGMILSGSAISKNFALKTDPYFTSTTAKVAVTYDGNTYIRSKTFKLTH
ncbi:hypothetical protein FACS1894110_19860 [Spirochaetia bacterium]|nr:hypothetical protein FACS1894110_19860 [Spirochaetia bacterium]